jgi:hypothetical protein
MTNLEGATPTTNVIHPRRLFTMPEDDESTCVKPSSVKPGDPNGFFPNANTPKRTGVHGLPLLAPSPTSGIYIEASQVSGDVEVLCEYLKNLGDNFSDGFLGTNGKVGNVPQLTTKQMGPLRDAIVQLQMRIYEQSTMAIITPLLTPPADVPEEEEDEKSVPLVASPTKAAFVCSDDRSQVSSSLSRVMDSRVLSSDLEHLRTIQKEVRGLFRSVDDMSVSVRSPSPISSRRGGLKLQVSTASSSTSQATSNGAGKISRLLTESSDEVKKQQSMIDAGLSQLTLSPTTELMERDSIRRNPWFATTGERKPLVPPESPMLRGRDVKSTGVAAALNVAMGHTRGARSQSRRRSLSTSAPAVPREEKRANDLISWLKKQAVTGSPGYSGGSAKKLASIYTSRHRGDSVKHLN